MSLLEARLLYILIYKSKRILNTFLYKYIRLNKNLFLIINLYNFKKHLYKSI